MLNNQQDVLSDNIAFVAKKVLELIQEEEKGRLRITSEQRELLHDVMLTARAVIIRCISNK